MKTYSWILPLIALGFSCANSQATAEQWTEDTVQPREKTQLIAGYNEGDGVCLLIRDAGSAYRAFKVTRVSGFPDVTDTLVRTSENTFKSLRDSTLFVIRDSTVTTTYYQKIIHPSSNWQGQTPWHETIVTNFPRRDLGLRTRR